VPRLRAVFFAAFFFARIAAAQWQVVSSDVEPGAIRGVEHRHLVLRHSATETNATIDLALLFPASTLRVIDNGAGFSDLRQAMEHGHCIAGVNGGYFDTDFRPLGLRVIDGAATSPLTRARLLTGVLCASSRGVTIVRVGEFSRQRKSKSAIECGPFLVDDGVRMKTLDDRRGARRTFAAVTRRGRAALGVSSELTLAQLAAVLANRSLANDLPIWRALNLDGGSSSAFWFRKSDGSAFSISEDKTVRDFIGVVAK
jgi:uncharacterized protein YigE (DUF2233 family)